MQNTNLIFNSPEYQNYLSELQELEKDRIYCRHGLDHYLDVGRIFYILCLEHHLEISRDLAYTTALLHDIGRVLEYKDKLPHDQGSVQIAKELLKKTNFKMEEKNLIIKLIGSHRENKESSLLETLFYKADKLSRNCFLCSASESCKWTSDEKNMLIKY